LRVTRREFLRLLAEGAVALGFLRISSLVPSGSLTEVVRPPGSVEEEFFNTLCVRCGVCVEVCPTNAIVFADYMDGVEAANTPKINPIIGPCEFYRGRCDTEMKCGKFCPTGALQLISKNGVKMGTALLNQGICLAYLGKECVVCDELCPVPDAITLDEQKRPHFHSDNCVGCGICVHYCPAQPKALTLSSTGARRVRWPR